MIDKRLVVLIAVLLVFATGIYFFVDYMVHKILKQEIRKLTKKKANNNRRYDEPQPNDQFNQNNQFNQMDSYYDPMADDELDELMVTQVDEEDVNAGRLKPENIGMRDIMGV